jgi:alpha-amylase
LHQDFEFCSESQRNNQLLIINQKPFSLMNLLFKNHTRSLAVSRSICSFSYIVGCFVALALAFSACSPKTNEIAPDTVHNNARVAATTAPVINGVMMQGFYWNVPQTTTAGTWWQNLNSKATELSDAGITAIWLPPTYKGGGATDVGYGVYDRYDLGEFNQKGTIATRYGTLPQLQSAITALHSKNVQVYGDIVMNHFAWADYQETVNSNLVWTGYNYTGRNNTYSSFKWNKNQFNGYQGAGGVWYQWNAWDFQPYNSGDAYDNLLGCEVRYNNNPTAVTETINWGNWLTTKLNLDGYRLDATKHIYTPFVNQWLDNVKGTRFAVGEAWISSVPLLQNYATATGGRMSLFDVPLHYTFKAMSDGNGAWDMRGLQFAGFTEANGPLSVSFVDNHDTDDNTGGLYSRVTNFKMMAYAYILTREKGYPCVFYRDFYEYGFGPQIKKLIQIRKTNGYGAGFEYTNSNDTNVYAYSRAGDATHKGLLMMLNDGSSNASKGMTTPFLNATLTDQTGNTAGTVTTNASGYGVFPVNSRNYAVWVPTGTVVTPPTTSTTAVTFNISYSNTVIGQDLYIIGSSTQLGNWNTANAIKLTGSPWPNWTKTINLTTGQSIDYKYLRKDQAGNILWESGANKTIIPTGTTQTKNDIW